MMQLLPLSALLGQRMKVMIVLYGISIRGLFTKLARPPQKWKFRIGDVIQTPFAQRMAPWK